MGVKSQVLRDEECSLIKAIKRLDTRITNLEKVLESIDSKILEITLKCRESEDDSRMNSMQSQVAGFYQYEYKFNLSTSKFEAGDTSFKRPKWQNSLDLEFQ